LNDLHGLKVGSFEMQAIRGHQFDAPSAASVDHFAAFLLGNCQRFFAEDMHSGASRADGEIAMQGIGLGNIDGVDLAVSEASMVVVR
jgi:hypothetical protein